MFKSHKTTTWAVIIAIFLVIGLWWIISLEQLANPAGLSAGSLDDVAGIENSGESENQPGFFEKIFNTDSKTYRDVSAKFLFKYPKDYELRELPPIAEGEGRTLLFAKEGEAPSLQIVVSSFDEDIVLTAERIRADVPDLVMNNAKEFAIGSVTKGVAWSDEVGVNVWFVAKGNLFQATAFTTDTRAMEQIFGSFTL